MHQLRHPLPRSPDRGGPLSRGSAPALDGAPGEPVGWARVRLVVCGEPSRGDDGLGPAVLEAVLDELPPAVRARLDVRRRPGLDPVDLLDLADDTAVIVVDCVVGVAPGTVVRLPLADLGRTGGPGPASTHTLPVADVVRLVEAVAGRPPPGVFLGLGGRSFELGAPLSPPVRAALPGFGAALRAEIDGLLDGILGYSPHE